MLVKAADKLVTTGTRITDATSLVSSIDDLDLEQTLAQCATKAAATFIYGGKTFGSTKLLKRAAVCGSSDQGYVNGLTPTVVLQCYGKVGAPPANDVDGTLLRTISSGFTDTVNESAPRQQFLDTIILPVDHAWIRVSHNGAAATMALAEVMLFEEWNPLLDYPTGQGYTRDNPVIGWHNIVTSSTISATSAETNNPISNLANPSTSLKWRATSAVLQHITLTGLSETVNYVAVARHNWGSAGILVSVEMSNDGTTWVEVVSPFTPTNDGPLIIRFPLVTFSNLRIRLQAGSDIPQAAVLYAGKLLVLQRRFYVDHLPITMGKQINAVSPLSESGEYLGRIVLSEYSATEISLQNLTPDWVRSEFMPFVDHSVELPYFFAWRPETYPLETAYCWSPQGDVPRPINQLPNGMMRVSWPVQGIVT